LLGEEYNYIVEKITTRGDQILNVSLSQIGGKGLFTKELEDGILDGRYHFAVHSLKDLPTILPEGLIIGAVTEREDPRDVLIVRRDLNHRSLEELPEGACVGSSSLRRISQLKLLYPHLTFKDIRGNLNTRFKKLDDVTLGYSAMLLAYAGVKRLGVDFESRITQILDQLYYAPGQGALGIECKENNTQILSILSHIHNEDSWKRCTAERKFLEALGGGCQIPLGVKSKIEGEILELEGMILSQDSSSHLTCKVSGPSNNPLKVGEDLAKIMIENGANSILSQTTKNENNNS